MTIKQRPVDQNSLLKAQKKIVILEEKIKDEQTNVKLFIELYMCYVTVGNSEKKIECLETVSELAPRDPYAFQQLADIYAIELDDLEKANFYQLKANKILKSF